MQETVAALDDGLTLAQIKTLFGEPDSIEIKLFGSETAYPWEGLVYRYRMGTDSDEDDFFRGFFRDNRLVFEKYENTWRLHHFEIRTVFDDEEVPEYCALPHGFNVIFGVVPVIMYPPSTV